MDKARAARDQQRDQPPTPDLADPTPPLLTTSTTMVSYTAFDLTTSRVTLLMPICVFAEALGKLLMDATVGEKLVKSSTADDSYGGMYTVGALREMSAVDANSFYAHAKLGCMFAKTVCPLLRVHGEDEFLHPSPKRMGTAEVCATGRGAPKFRSVSFADYVPDFADSLTLPLEIAHLPGMIKDLLPQNGGSIVKVQPIVAAIKNFLFLKYQCIHWAHSGSSINNTDLFARRLAELICLDEKHGGHEIELFEGKPSVRYRLEMGVELLVDKVKSKITQDRQNVRQVVEHPGKTKARVVLTISPRDAERVEALLDAGFSSMYRVCPNAKSLALETTADSPPSPGNSALVSKPATAADRVPKTPLPPAVVAGEAAPATVVAGPKFATIFVPGDPGFAQDNPDTFGQPPLPPDSNVLADDTSSVRPMRGAHQLAYQAEVDLLRKANGE